jgi:hypothetical protein
MPQSAAFFHGEASLQSPAIGWDNPTAGSINFSWWKGADENFSSTGMPQSAAFFHGEASLQSPAIGWDNPTAGSINFSWWKGAVFIRLTRSRPLGSPFGSRISGIYPAPPLGHVLPAPSSTADVDFHPFEVF